MSELAKEFGARVQAVRTRIASAARRSNRHADDILLVAVSAHLFAIIPKEFIPSQDTGRIIGFTEGAQGISYEAMVAHQQAVARIIKRYRGR